MPQSRKNPIFFHSPAALRKVRCLFALALRRLIHPARLLMVQVFHPNHTDMVSQMVRIVNTKIAVA